MAASTAEQQVIHHIDKPNPEKDLTEKVAKHYNELQETGLQARTQSRIFYLRNFNNWIKSVLISDTLARFREAAGSNASIGVLDLCSGKGGDLLKWNKGRVNQVVCVDIAGTSVEQCEARYRDLIGRSSRDRFPQKIFSAEFITADCTKVRLKDKYKDPTLQFDITSCQFSFHYCFESLPQAQMMLANACECLKPGGFFIGTTPNSSEIMRRMRESGNNSFGDDVCRISFDSEDADNLPLFGAKYNFHLEGVVDCPEFLVYFPLLEKLAETYGMKLVYQMPFAEFFTKHIGRGDHRSLLGRMQALEPYPPDDGVQLMGDSNDDYSHAKKIMEQLDVDSKSQPNAGDRKKPVKVGTMSKSEWDAASLYLVFVFQKNSAEQLASAATPERKRQAENTQDVPEKMTKLS